MQRCCLQRERLRVVPRAVRSAPGLRSCLSTHAQHTPLCFILEVLALSPQLLSLLPIATHLAAPRPIPSWPAAARGKSSDDNPTSRTYQRHPARRACQRRRDTAPRDARPSLFHLCSTQPSVTHTHHMRYHQCAPARPLGPHAPPPLLCFDTLPLPAACARALNPRPPYTPICMRAAA